MNPYLAYRRADPAAGCTRMDLLLALYDKALEHLDRADVVSRAGGRAAATGLVIKAQLVVTALAAGVRSDADEAGAANVLRLYEYAVHQLADPWPHGVANARAVLRTLRDGFEAVRDEANALERAGHLPAADPAHLVHATA